VIILHFLGSRDLRLFLLGAGMAVIVIYLAVL
jgi:hypothetical protein